MVCRDNGTQHRNLILNSLLLCKKFVLVIVKMGFSFSSTILYDNTVTSAGHHTLHHFKIAEM